MNTCPKCENGKTTIQIQNFGKITTVEKRKVNCYFCGGVGKVSEKQLKNIQEHDRFIVEKMCSCEEPTFGSYPQDGECDCGMHKHHVHCGTCGKISQIG